MIPDPFSLVYGFLAFVVLCDKIQGRLLMSFYKIPCSYFWLQDYIVHGPSCSTRESYPGKASCASVSLAFLPTRSSVKKAGLVGCSAVVIIGYYIEPVSPLFNFNLYYKIR